MWKEIGIQFGTVLGIVIGLIISPAIFLWSLIKRARAVHAEGVLCTAEVVPIDVDEPGRSIGARLAGPSLVRFSGTTNREGKEEQGILGLALRTRLPRDRDGTPEVGDQDIVFGTFESFVSLIFRKDSNRVDPHDYLLNEYDSVAPWRLPEIGIVRLRILRVLEAPAKGSGATRRARLEEDIRDGFAEMLLTYHCNDGQKEPRIPIAVLRLTSLSPLPPQQLRISLRRKGRGIIAVGFRNGIRRIVYPVGQLARRIVGG